MGNTGIEPMLKQCQCLVLPLDESPKVFRCLGVNPYTFTENGGHTWNRTTIRNLGNSYTLHYTIRPNCKFFQKPTTLFRYLLLGTQTQALTAFRSTVDSTSGSVQTSIMGYEGGTKDFTSEMAVYEGVEPSLKH